MAVSDMRFAFITAFTLIGLWLRPSQEVFGQSEDGLARSGCPHQIAKYARVSNARGYLVYYVGGGARANRGEYRNCTEGTFGVDYSPIVPGFHDAVALQWWHGRRQQGGPGQYEPNAKVTPFPNFSRRNVGIRPSID